MPTLYTLTGFTFFDFTEFGGGIQGLAPSTLVVQASDDLAVTFTATPSTDPTDVTGELNATTGEFLGFVLDGTSFSPNDEFASFTMGRYQFNGQTTDFIGLVGFSGQVWIFPAAGDLLGEALPTPAEIQDIMTNGSLSDIPSALLHRDRSLHSEL